MRAAFGFFPRHTLRATKDSLTLRNGGLENGMGAHQSDKPAHPRPPGASPPGGCSRPSAVESKAHGLVSLSAVRMRGTGGLCACNNTSHEHTQDNTNTVRVLETTAPQWV